MRLISVVMGVPTYKGREVESKKLLQWGFANFETLKTYKANEEISNNRFTTVIKVTLNLVS